jgi:hypothetical protein
MTELERFEDRLAASLVRLADEAPVEVDAVELTQKVASSSRGFGGLRLGRAWLPSALRSPLVTAAQAALIVGLILVLIAAVVLGQRIAQRPYPGMLTGELACAGTPWTATDSGPVVLECSTKVQDARLVGTARIVIGAPTATIQSERRQSTVELRADDATWRGDLELMVNGNGTAAGDALLIGEGGAAGLLGRLHFVTADGVTWGVVGSMSSAE